MNALFAKKWLSRFTVACLLGVLTITPVLNVAAQPLSATTDDFVITVKTDNAGVSLSTQFIIPTTGSGYNYNVDCNNDGTNEATAQTGNYTCSYDIVGTYTVRIKDNSGLGTGFPRIYFNNGGDRKKLLTIAQWGTGKWTSMASAFYGCQSVTMTATDVPNLSGVTDMSSMFSGAYAFNGDIGAWNTASVTNMSGLFTYATFFNQDIGAWNTASVTNMNNMFGYAGVFNQNIGAWNTASVTNMNQMFFSADDFNQDISAWNTANVTNMGGMFYFDTLFNQNLGGWNVSSLLSASSMFASAGLSTSNYDALLIGWNAQNLKPSVTLDGGSAKYCLAASARANMIASDLWTISDGGFVACPEIDIAQSGTPIADGGTYDFADHALNSNTDAVFTLANSGPADLTLTTPISISGVNANQFSIQVQPVSPVSASGQTTFTIRFHPTSAGVKTATISIASNDENENPYDLTITGSGPIERAINGGFNIYSGVSKIPTNWVKSKNFASTDGKNTKVKKEGTASVRIGGAISKIKTLSQTLTLSGSAGQRFAFSYSVKGSAIPTSGLCQAQVFFYKGSTLVGKSSALKCSTGTYNWKKKSLAFNSPAAYTKVMIKFTYSNASGTVYFDGASLVK